VHERLVLVDKNNTAPLHCCVVQTGRVHLTSTLCLLDTSSIYSRIRSAPTASAERRLHSDFPIFEQHNLLTYNYTRPFLTDIVGFQFSKVAYCK